VAQTGVEIVAEIQASYTLVDEPIPGPFAVTERFKQLQNNPAGIRAPHAIDALNQAQDVNRWKFADDSYISLAVARATSKRPYAALVQAVEIPAMGRQTQIAGAWRLYASDLELGDPTQCLGWLVESFGLQLRISGSPSQRFFAQLTVEGDPEVEVDFTANEGDELDVSMFMRRSAQGANELTFIYALQTATYGRYVAANR